MSTVPSTTGYSISHGTANSENNKGQVLSGDILRQVFAQIEAPVGLPVCTPNSSPRHYFSTLAAAACVSKAFHREALYFLWRDLPSFDPVLRLLSTSVTLVEEQQNLNLAPHVDGSLPFGGGECWKLVAPITASVRRRLMMYLRYTRTLNLHSTWPVKMAVFHALFKAGLYSRLAPRLHTIYGTSSWYNVHEALLLLSSPRLRELTLDLGHLYRLLGRRMPSVVRSLCNAAPGLEKLVLLGNSVPLSRACIDLFAGLEHLRVFDMSALSGTVLQCDYFIPALARLEYLEELALPDRWDSSTSPFAPGKYDLPPSEGFKQLKKLTVVGGAWVVPALFAAYSNDLRLTELRLVDLKHGCIPPLDKIVLSCSHALRYSIEVLHISYVLRFTPRPGAVGPPPAPPEVVRAISPFFGFPSIRTFSLATEGDCLIEDDDLYDIGEAWPRLVSLAFDYNAPVKSEMSIAPSIHGITALVDACPGLRRLLLPFIITLHSPYAVLPAYHRAARRYLPLPAGLPKCGVEDDDIDRVVDIMHPLFGVVDSPDLQDPSLFPSIWREVLYNLAQMQNRDM